MNRNCGKCTLCCTVLAIPELDKPMGDRCGFQGRKSCLGYDHRPRSCREFECGYLQSDALPAYLHPAQCGFFLSHDQEGERAVIYCHPKKPDAWKKGAAGQWVEHTLRPNLEVIVICGDTRILLTHGELA